MKWLLKLLSGKVEPDWTDLSKIEERLFAGIASNAPGERFPNKLWVGEPVGERQNDVHMLAALDSIKDWCRCGGNGFWYEQIDGPDNMRKVKCERHEESNQSE